MTAAQPYSPPKLNARDIQSVAERRYELKDILNTNLLSPEGRKEFEKQYAETGRILEEAAAKGSS